MKKFLSGFAQKKALRKSRNISRERQYRSLVDAKSVAFIFNVHDLGILDGVSFLKEELKKNSIPYKAIAVDIAKEALSIPAYQSDPNIINLHIEDTNWYGLPNKSLVLEFENNKFDILFDLSFNRVFTIDYLLNTSNALLKISTSPLMKESCDLIIEESTRTLQPKEYIIKVIDYLTTIKSPL